MSQKQPDEDSDSATASRFNVLNWCVRCCCYFWWWNKQDVCGYCGNG